MSENFHYKAYLLDDTIEGGVVEASNLKDAENILVKSNKRLISLNPEKGNKSTFSSKRFGNPKPNLHLFFQNISMLVGAGLNVDKAISTLAKDEKNHTQNTFYNNISKELASGSSFAQACEGTGTISGEIIALLNAGEHSGNLRASLSIITEDITIQKERNKKLFEAILYPIFLVVMMLVALVIITFVLVPALEPLFSTSGKTPPFLIGLLASLKTGLENNSAYLMLVVCIIFITCFLSRGRNFFKNVFSKVVEKTPFIGKALKDAALARYLKTLSLLQSNGVATTKALQISAQSGKSENIKKRMTTVPDDVAAGIAISQALENTELFENSVISIIKAGDEINKVDVTLNSAAELLANRSHQSLERLMTFLTPAITIILGLLIGALALSVMSAMLSINELAS
ncbi:MAG: type II secretion system F family protein [Rhodobacteraceae bacterium]|nr:type II secretion system F family protein [Paracoccaceae bacterium]